MHYYASGYKISPYDVFLLQDDMRRGRVIGDEPMCISIALQSAAKLWI